MEPDLKLAIETVNKLFDDRDAPGWWAQNIIDAARCLTCEKSTTKFYSYLANPGAFDHTQEHEMLGDSPETMEWEYPSYMKEERIPNGPDTIIHVRNVRDRAITMDIDDEKTEQ